MSMLSAPFRVAGSTRIDPPLVVLWLCLIVLAVVWIVPFVFIVFTALKSQPEILSGNPILPPLPPLWQNFAKAWVRGGFSTTMFNSVVITLIKVPLGILISAMAAYSLARIEFRGQRIVFLLIVFGTMIPFQVMLAPIFGVVNGFHLINTYVGVILPYLAFGVPYQVFILYGFFKEVPRELSEAAQIDGANHFTIFWRIFLLAALLILDFVATWNEFAMALVILQAKTMWTLPLGLMSFQSQFSSNYGELNSAIVMTVLPAIIVYLIFQRYFVSGLTSGAVKE
jgi:raffinose/stachyose/melibiose transport system permease protein